MDASRKNCLCPLKTNENNNLSCDWTTGIIATSYIVKFIFDHDAFLLEAKSQYNEHIYSIRTKHHTLLTFLTYSEIIT